MSARLSREPGKRVAGKQEAGKQAVTVLVGCCALLPP